MEPALRIVVGEDNVDHCHMLVRVVESLGHRVVGKARTGSELVELANSREPDLVITDIKMPDMDGLDAADAIYKCRPLPIIIVSALFDNEFIERAQQRHILAFLTKPVAEKDLGPAIAIVLSRFEEYRVLEEENAGLKSALEDRKYIERAKGILMKQTGMDEKAAFQRMQKLARDQRTRLGAIAKMVIETASLLEVTQHEAGK